GGVSGGGYAVEAEGGVFAVGRVEIAAGGGGAGVEPHRSLAADEPPRQHREWRSLADEALVLDAAPVGKRERPARPRIGREGDDPRCAVGMRDVGRIAVRREGDGPARGLGPDLETVYEHHAPGGRRRPPEHERAVAPRAG